MNDALDDLSELRARLVTTSGARVLALRLSPNHSVSAIHWQDAYVVTAADALRGDDDVEASGATATVRARVVGVEPAVDVAVLKLSEFASTTTLPLTDGPETGKTVGVVGRCADGVLAAWGSVKLSAGPWVSQRGGQLDRRLELDVRFDRRLEGALVLDATGGAIGMAVPGPRGRVLCIPASTIQRVITAVVQHGHVPRPFVGLRLQPLWLDRASAASLELPAHTRSVAVVTAVEPGSPAAAADVRVGDWLVAAAGSSLTGAPAFASVIACRQPGDVVELSVHRAGARATLKVQIGDRPH
jgi:S1-C subfamily serine protease